MPRGRHKTPFSAKKKKVQLKLKKKLRQQNKNPRWLQSDDEDDEHNENVKAVIAKADVAIPDPKAGHDPRRFRLHFQNESKAELEKRKRMTRKPIIHLPDDELEVDPDSAYLPGSALDFPQRPKWNYDMTKEELYGQEQEYFDGYLKQIKEDHPEDDLSYFEHNLETWRQLWRVLEISDVVFLIMDVRFVPIHFPPALAEYILRHNKQLLLVLNKCDLVSKETVNAWKDYLQTRYPSIGIVTFSSFHSMHQGNPASRRKFRRKLLMPEGLEQLVSVWEQLGLPGADEWKAKIDNERENIEQLLAESKLEEELENGILSSDVKSASHERKKNRQRAKKLRNKQRYAAMESADDAGEEEGEGGGDDDGQFTDDEDSDGSEEEEENIDKYEEGADTEDHKVPEALNEDDNKSNANADRNNDKDSRDEHDDATTTDHAVGGKGDGKHHRGDASAANAPDYEKRDSKRKFITIGMVGQPNVGKSTIINSMVGKSVVSTSRTPGHTKHFQTYFLSPSIRLCDCPGLVFPSLVQKPLQILAGLYPISQVREPYTPIQYLGERIDLVSLLKLKPDEDARDAPWSAWTICEQWAAQRGFYTAKAGRLDTYRAANDLLRHAVDGRIVLSLKPPGYFAKAPKQLQQGNRHTDADTDDSKKAAVYIPRPKAKSRYVVLNAPQGGPAEITGGEDSDSESDDDTPSGSSNPFALLETS